MIADVGREIQRDLGIEKPTGDFGLELLAGPHGILFRPGSIEAQLAITSNIDTGVVAAKRVVSTVDALAKKQPNSVATDADRSVVRRLKRINKSGGPDKTELHLILHQTGNHEIDHA